MKRQNFNLLVLLSVMLGISGCDTLDARRSISTEYQKQIARIGVVSSMGDEFQFIYVGMTVFSNAQHDANVASWNIEKVSAEQVVKMINGGGRFSAALLDRTGLDDQALSADHAKRAWELARLQGFDTLVVVLPNVSQNFARFVPGYGLMLHNLPLIDSKPCIYSAFTVEVMNVASQRRIAWEWGNGDRTPCEFPVKRTLDYRESMESYSSEEQKGMRDGVISRTENEIRYALRELNLVPE